MRVVVHPRSHAAFRREKGVEFLEFEIGHFHDSTPRISVASADLTVNESEHRLTPYLGSLFGRLFGEFF